MKEADLRKWHRISGLFLAVLILLQAGSGLILSSIEDLWSLVHSDSEYGSKQAIEIKAPVEEFLESIHTEGGALGYLYRIVVGFGLFFMAGSGGLIFVQIQARQRARGKP